MRILDEEYYISDDESVQFNPFEYIIGLIVCLILPSMPSLAQF